MNQHTAHRRSTALYLAAGLVLALAAQAVSARNTALFRPRDLPEYTANGDLILPKNFNEWIYSIAWYPKENAPPYGRHSVVLACQFRMVDQGDAVPTLGVQRVFKNTPGT